MKKISLFLVSFAAIAFNSFGQKEFSNFELKYNGIYGATPIVTTQIGTRDGLAIYDTNRVGEVNAYEFGGAAYFNFGLGVEFDYSSHNRYFDTLAGNGSSYSIGLAYRKAFMGPGSLFESGYNVAFKVGAGYVHAEKTDQIEYVTTYEWVSTSKIWSREKSFSGFYADGKFDIFRDDPFSTSDYFLYGASLTAGVKYPMVNRLSESVDGKTVKGSWLKEDSVSVVNVNLEVKPVIVPLNKKMGLSLITGLGYGNFNSYNTYSPGVNFKVGVSLDGFTKFGECARITYTRVSRENYVSNEVNFGIEVIQLCRTLFF